ncbi:MAG TPA: phasin family protein [Nitrococcus sp.]|nr:phasin family protein [Nitrococcus sp.]
MYEGLFTDVSASFGQFLAPARKFNSLIIENAGKVAEFQINAAQSYTDIGLKRFREALRVSNVADLQRLMASQNETNRTLAAKFLADTHMLVNLGQDFSKEIQKFLAEDIAAFVMPAASNDATKASAASSSHKSA